MPRSNFTFALRRDKLRPVRRREGRYPLCSNLSAQAPEKLWQFYIQLTQVEAAFEDLKDDLSLRPIFHSAEPRIEAHIFVAFLADCLHVTLRACLRPLAPGLTPRSLLGKFVAIQMVDVHFPTSIATGFGKRAGFGVEAAEHLDRTFQFGQAKVLA
jgi:hypothetical protein